MSNKTLGNIYYETSKTPYLGLCIVNIMDKANKPKHRGKNNTSIHQLMGCNCTLGPPLTFTALCDNIRPPTGPLWSFRIHFAINLIPVISKLTHHLTTGQKILTV